MSALEQLQHEYRASLRTKAADLQRAFDALCDEDVREDQVRHFHLLLHRLAGSAGTYGYESLGRSAQELEQLWRDWLERLGASRPEAWRLCADQAAVLAELLGQMRALAD